MPGHGANRDLCVCGSPGPSRRDCVRASRRAGVPCRRPRRRRQPLVERRTWPPRARAAGDRRAAPAAVQTRAIAVPRELGARAGSTLAPRVGARRFTRRGAEGRAVASCGQFSHTPCGSAVTAAVNASGYRYATFGENLFAGTWGRSPRATSSRLAPVSAAPGEHAQRAVPRRRAQRRSGRTGCSAAATPSSGPPVRLSR